MKILVANDDGVYAPGIKILAETLKTIADIDVVAPDRNRSGASNSLTLDRPLRVKSLDNGYHSVEGTPTDCVHLALTGLLDEPPDMVVSGVNAGSNLGDDILYSGTVAAAIEGRFLGLPAIAVSLVGCTNNGCQNGHSNVFKHFATGAEVAKQLVMRLQVDPLPAQTILNVNVPDLPLAEIRGFAVCRLGQRHKAEAVIKELDPRGHEIFWFGPAGAESDAGPGTDFYAVSQGYVSITPLTLDLTNFKAFEQLSGWTNGLNQ